MTTPAPGLHRLTRPRWPVAVPRKTKLPKAAGAPKAPAPGRASGCMGALFNLLTLLVLLLTCASGVAVAALFQDPSPLQFIRGGSAYLPATDLPIEEVLLDSHAGSGHGRRQLPHAAAGLDGDQHAHHHAHAAAGHGLA